MAEKWNEIILINNINLRSLNYIELPSYSSLLESWSTQTLLSVAYLGDAPPLARP